MDLRRRVGDSTVGVARVDILKVVALPEGSSRGRLSLATDTVIRFDNHKRKDLQRTTKADPVQENRGDLCTNPYNMSNEN